MVKQFASFYLGDSLFGIDVLLVREINKNIEISDVDPSPDYVVGLMNLRGQIVTVLDLGIRLGLRKRTISDDTCCIVLKTIPELGRYKSEGFAVEETSKDMVGLMADKVGDMIEVDESEIETPPANVNGIESKYLSGVVKLEKELLVTLRMEEVLRITEQGARS
jgi:purine-binding chemotaxis protein CheW